MDPLTPEDFKNIIDYMLSKGLHRPYDVAKISFEITQIDDKNTRLEYQDAGVNWWLELLSDWTGNYEKIRNIIAKGPSRI
jgi:hypothetical protein